MEEIGKIQTEIPENICTIEIDYYGRKLSIGSISGRIYLFDTGNNTWIKTSEILSHTGPINYLGVILPMVRY